MDDQTVRCPRIRLNINGISVDGCVSAEVVNCRGSKANAFRVVLSSTEVARRIGSTWIDKDPIDVSIDFGFYQFSEQSDAIQWVRMISGQADRISLNQVSGTVSLDGRDYASRLMDGVLQDGFLNKTSSEIAASLAAQFGLSANVDDSSGLIGQYYQIQHTKSSFAAFSRHANAWDLLAELADIEGFDLWIEDSTLNFRRPRISESDIFDVSFGTSSTTGASPSLTISNLLMERLAGLSSGVQVRVVSWNSRQRSQVESIYPTNTTGNLQQFTILRPNLLPDEAQKLARTSFNGLRVHQRMITGTMAGELKLTPRHRVRLSGTGTGWDGLYTLDRVEREISLQGGFHQHITARIDPSDGSSNG